MTDNHFDDGRSLQQSSLPSNSAEERYEMYKRRMLQGPYHSSQFDELSNVCHNYDRRQQDALNMEKSKEKDSIYSIYNGLELLSKDASREKVLTQDLTTTNINVRFRNDTENAAEAACEKIITQELVRQRLSGLDIPVCSHLSLNDPRIVAMLEPRCLMLSFSGSRSIRKACICTFLHNGGEVSHHDRTHWWLCDECRALGTYTSVSFKAHAYLPTNNVFGIGRGTLLLSLIFRRNLGELKTPMDYHWRLHSVDLETCRKARKQWLEFADASKKLDNELYKKFLAKAVREEDAVNLRGGMSLATVKAPRGWKNLKDLEEPKDWMETGSEVTLTPSQDSMAGESTFLLLVYRDRDAMKKKKKEEEERRGLLAWILGY